MILNLILSLNYPWPIDARYYFQDGLEISKNSNDTAWTELDQKNNNFADNYKGPRTTL